MANQISLDTSPDSYFCDILQEAARKSQFQIKEPVTIYLIDLLKTFIQPEKLKVVIGDKHITPFNTPLALIIGEIQEVQDDYKKQKALRMIGDYSLYYSGFFQDYFNNKSFGIDYYISIGQRAYYLLKNQDKKLEETYASLSEHFTSYMDLVSEVSAHSPIKQNKDLLAVYERWTKSPSQKLTKILQDFGINPDQSFVTKKVS